jgi:hypothetical protein
LRKTLELKLKTRAAQEEQELRTEAERLRLRGGASVQALLATLPGEQADRVLRLAELEMRRGLSEEQALAMVAEKSPEIAPAIAEALKARYSRTDTDAPAARRRQPGKAYPVPEKPKQLPDS